MAGYDADLERVTIFDAGVMPRPFSNSSEIAVRVGVKALAAAFNASLAKRRNVDRAAEVYVDIDFEASTTSRLVLAATVLEILSMRVQREANDLGLIDRWAAEASLIDSPDLVAALSTIRTQSIASSIRALMKAACADASLTGEDTDQVVRRTVDLYHLRSAAVHAGSDVRPHEAAELRSIARFALTGSRDRGVFSGVVEGFALDKTSRPNRRSGPIEVAP